MKKKATKFQLSYMRQYYKRRYKWMMVKIIRYLGGKCVRCGATTHLQIDHKDRHTKEFNVTTGIYKRSKKALWAEVKKCQLLCATCHREKGIESGDVLKAKHGGYSMYARRGCRCDLCVEYNRSRHKKYELNKRIKTGASSAPVAYPLKNE